MYMIYEFCDGGNLEELLHRKRAFTENEALYFFKQIINGYFSLYKRNILHRDLKLQNILLKDGSIKIADFGFCKILSRRNDLTSTIVGSPIYMAPEILKGKPYT